MRLRTHLEELRRDDDQRYRERVIGMAFIGVFAWHEIQRRLTVLNHAHEEAVRVQHTYVTEEKFEAVQKAVALQDKVVDEALSIARGRAIGFGQIAALLAGAVTIIGGVVLIANGVIH